MYKVVSKENKDDKIVVTAVYIDDNPIIYDKNITAYRNKDDEYDDFFSDETHYRYSPIYDENNELIGLIPSFQDE